MVTTRFFILLFLFPDLFNFFVYLTAKCIKYMNKNICRAEMILSSSKLSGVRVIKIIGIMKRNLKTKKADSSTKKIQHHSQT